MKRFLSIILIASLILSLSFTSFAENKDNTVNTMMKQNNILKAKNKLDRIKKDKDFVIVSEGNAGSYSVVPSKNVKDKKTYLAKLEEVRAQDDSYILEDTTSRSVYDSFIRNGFSSVAYGDWAFVTGEEITYNGDSFANWLGDSPYYADKIDSSDTFNYGYVGLSLSIGSADAGGTLTSTSSGCKITYPTIEDNWSVDHHFTNIYARAYVFTSTTELADATFTFGGSSYTIQSSKYQLTPH